MEGTSVLDTLLILSIALGLTLTFMSQAAVGRGLSDIERQSARRITGGPRIQSWANLRIHANRVLFGIVFVTINVMLVAGVPEIWRMWTFRILWIALLLTYNASAVLDWIAERQLVQLGIDRQTLDLAAREVLAQEAEDRRTADSDMDRESHRQITEQAIADLERVAKESGARLPVPLADVVPEHASPVTPQQLATAQIQTLRARLVAVRLALGFSTESAIDVKDTPNASNIPS